MYNSDYLKENFYKFYVDNGPENGILQGTKYAGCATHCRACVNTLVRMYKPKSVLEIGSWHYESSTAMATAMDNYIGEEGIVHSYDIKYGGYDGLGTAEGLHKRITPRFWYSYNTSYDSWKYQDTGVVFKDFSNFTNDDIFEKNEKILREISPIGGYDFIFLDGDHSFEGVKRDFEHALSIKSKTPTIIVFDNIWDTRLQDVRDFFNTISYDKWDFEEWNDSHLNMVQDTGVVFV